MMVSLPHTRLPKATAALPHPVTVQRHAAMASQLLTQLKIPAKRAHSSNHCSRGHEGQRYLDPEAGLNTADRRGHITAGASS